MRNELCVTRELVNSDAERKTHYARRIARKGQITLFIIIGLLILLSIGIAVYLQTTRVIKPLEEAPKVPSDIRPVYDYVTSCVYGIAKPALIRMGLQGGYLEIPPAIAKNAKAHVALDSRGIAKVPMWYFEAENRIPGISFMERQLKNHIEDNFEPCRNFSAFREFKVEERGSPNVTVTLARDNVVVKLDWPLIAVKPEKSISQNEYVTFVDVPLRRMHELAANALEKENEFEWFENMTVNLMAADPDIPMDGVEFSCARKKWRLEHVKERLARVLRYNIPLVRLAGTNYPPYIEGRKTYEGFRKEHERIWSELAKTDKFKPPVEEPPDDAYEYFQLTFDAQTPPTELKAAFEFQPEWSLLLTAHPRDGSTLKSNMGTGAGKLLRFLCFNQWHFTYDVIYPVVMTVKSDNALGGEGFIYRMAFPVLIDDNNPSRIRFDQRRFEAFDYATDFCQQLGDKAVEVRALGLTDYSSIPVELEGANITYYCANEECYLGQTVADQGYYRLRTLLPASCSNPVLVASKEGYLGASSLIKEGRADVFMTRLKNLSLRVLKQKYFEAENRMEQTPVALGDKESASVRITVLNANHDIFADYPVDETVALVEGRANYDVDVIVRNALGSVVAAYSAENISIAVAPESRVIEVYALEYLPTPVDDSGRAKLISKAFEPEVSQKLRPVAR